MQMTDAFAIVSHDASTRTNKFSFVIRVVAKAKANVTARGSPAVDSVTSESDFESRMVEVATFRNRDDYDGHSDDDDLYEKDSFFIRCPSNCMGQWVAGRQNETLNHLGGFLVIISTMNLINSAAKRSPPAMVPTFAMRSARSFNLSCKGVCSESRRKATSHWLVRERKRKEG